MNCDLDHLVIAAHTLEQGAAWCEATLGVAPGPGGRHTLFGTHNRLLRIDGPGFANSYLEVIAIDPEAPPPGRARWFGLDDAALQADLRLAPRLIGAVLRTPNVEMLRWGLINFGQDPGPALAAERATPAGLLSWRILVRDDGALPGGGRLPVLIQWNGVHPTEAMPVSTVALQSATFGAITPREAQLLRLRGPGRATELGAPAFSATLSTPRGNVTLATR